MSRLTINSNTSSLNAQRSLFTATRKLQDSYTRLSSGLRINKSSDDAAGLSISESLKADTRIQNQGIKNLNDGASLLNIADGALSELSNIMIRLNELATQASNGTMSNKQRLALDQEAQALSKEYNRIARTTEFNGRKLFDGDFGGLSLAAGGSSSTLISSGLGGAIGDGTFLAETTIATTTASFYLDSVDLNNDTYADLIFSNSVNARVEYKLGNGDGTFGATRIVSNMSQAVGVAVRDFNGDGYFDIAAADSFLGIISVNINNGDGSFKVPTTYFSGGAGALPGNNLMSEDFNNDGIFDLATTEFNNNILRVFIGNSDGTFRASQTYQAGTAANEIAAKDLDLDGFIDIVATNYTANTISIYKGNGDGTFRNFSSFSAPAGNVNYVEIVDFNDDGLFDFATSNSGGLIHIYTNQGNLQFSSPSAYSVGTQNADIRTADFNGDGYIDIASSEFGTNSVSILLGNGNGTFKTRQSYSAGTQTRALLVNDFNNDGVQDFIVSDQGTSSIRIRLGNSNDGVSALQSFSLRTQYEAKEAFTYVKKGLDRITQQRGKIGAFQSRIETATNNLFQSKTAYNEAYSSIVDADVAEESSKLVASQIIQQAAASVLAQANQQPSLALNLLRDI